MDLSISFLRSKQHVSLGSPNEGGVTKVKVEAREVVYLIISRLCGKDLLGING